MPQLTNPIKTITELNQADSAQQDRNAPNFLGIFFSGVFIMWAWQTNFKLNSLRMGVIMTVTDIELAWFFWGLVTMQWCTKHHLSLQNKSWSYHPENTKRLKALCRNQGNSPNTRTDDSDLIMKLQMFVLLYTTWGKECLACFSA